MDNKLEKVKQILKEYNQEHLIQFYDELTKEQREILLNQILRIDFNKIFTLYDNSMKDEEFSMKDISPIKHLEKKRFNNQEIQYYTQIGEKAIESNSVAVITMAGGQGTRLGYKGPKGTYKLDLKPQRKSLFEIMCEDLKRINEKYNANIPWYIMTSEENDQKTKEFFEKNNYFDYDKNKITFFIQDKLPIITIDKKLILQEIYSVKEASNGNGNVFKAMYKNNIIDELSDKGIKWLSFGGIDNVLLKNVDAFFIGLTIDKNYSIASKSIFKEAPLEKVAVYCKRKGKPSILGYDNISLELSILKDEDDMYLYREANMLSHLMSIESVKKCAQIHLNYHRAFKKNSFVNEEGMKQVSDTPNSFKFENFIFDAFSHFDDMLILRVDPNEEFAPIKDFTGIYNPDTAKEKYNNYWKKHTI